MLAHVASSARGLTAALVATSSLHCLSPKRPCQNGSQPEMWEDCMLDVRDSSKILDLREMRKYGTWTWTPACYDIESSVFILGLLHLSAEPSASKKTYHPRKAKCNHALRPLQSVEYL